MKFRNRKYSKLMEPNLLGKFSLAWKWANYAQKGPICWFVSYYSIFLRIGLLVFFVFFVFCFVFLLLIFCVKLRDHKYSKLMRSNFFGKFWFAQKRAKKPKMARFLCLPITTALFSRLVWSWGKISTQNWRSWVFWKNSCLCKNGPKRPKMVWFSVRPLWQQFFSGLVH